MRSRIARTFSSGTWAFISSVIVLWQMSNLQCRAVRRNTQAYRNVFDRDVTPSRAGELEAGTRFRHPRGRSLVSCSPSKSDQRCDESILMLIHHGCQHRSGFCHAFTYTYVRPDWCDSSGYVSSSFHQFELSFPVVHSSCQQY